MQKLAQLISIRITCKTCNFSIHIGIFILDVAVVCTTCLTMHRRINDLSQNGVGVTQIKGHR